MIKSHVLYHLSYGLGLVGGHTIRTRVPAGQPLITSCLA